MALNKGALGKKTTRYLLITKVLGVVYTFMGYIPAQSTFGSF